MLTDEMKADGWIEHDGGPRPLGLIYPVEVMFRDGEREVAHKAGEFNWISAAHRFGRDVYPKGWFGDIIAYKPENSRD